MNVYLSGPMSGIAEHNFPLFHRVTAYLRDKGHTVVNPAEHFEGRTDLDRRLYMRYDFARLLLECDAAAFLPFWEHSRGATIEFLIAKELGYELYVLRPLPDGKTYRDSFSLLRVFPFMYPPIRMVDVPRPNNGAYECPPHRPTTPQSPATCSKTPANGSASTPEPSETPPPARGATT